MKGVARSVRRKGNAGQRKEVAQRHGWDGETGTPRTVQVLQEDESMGAGG